MHKYHYIKITQDGALKRVGIEVSHNNICFASDKHMAFLGVEARMQVFEALVVLADAIQAGGNVLGGYEELLNDTKQAIEKYRGQLSQ